MTDGDPGKTARDDVRAGDGPTPGAMRFSGSPSRAAGSTSVEGASQADCLAADSSLSEAAAETFANAPIGAYLRRQRRLRAVSLEELADLTRIPLRSLERLEAGGFDGETDGFARGFVRTVAEALGLDVEDAISRMLHEPAPGVWERGTSSRRARQAIAVAGLTIGLLLVTLVLQSGWRLLVGGGATDRSRSSSGATPSARSRTRSEPTSTRRVRSTPRGARGSNRSRSPRPAPGGSPGLARPVAAESLDAENPVRGAPAEGGRLR